MHLNRWSAAVIVALGLALPAQARAQDSLEVVVEQARALWVDHAVHELVAHSDTVRLHIPGVAPSASLRPEQAARLLERYLKPTSERSFDLENLRKLAPDHAYAEVRRVYVVAGTSETRQETVFLGFRQIEGRWRLREVRVTP